MRSKRQLLARWLLAGMLLASAASLPRLVHNGRPLLGRSVALAQTVRLSTIRLTHLGMHCSACSRKVDEALQALPGIRSAQIDWRRDEVTLRFDPKTISLAKITQALTQAGYPPRG